MCGSPSLTSGALTVGLLSTNSVGEIGTIGETGVTGKVTVNSAMLQGTVENVSRTQGVSPSFSFCSTHITMTSCRRMLTG